MLYVLRFFSIFIFFHLFWEHVFAEDITEITIVADFFDADGTDKFFEESKKEIHPSVDKEEKTNNNLVCFLKTKGYFYHSTYILGDAGIRKFIQDQIRQLAHFLKSMKEQPDRQSLPYPSLVELPLRRGNKNPLILNIRSKLVAEGYLSRQAPKNIIGSLTIFDEELERGVCSFQKKHTLLPDGIIGLKTYESMSQSAAMHCERLKKNIQRWQDLEKIVPEGVTKAIIVNIPSYTMYAIHKGAVSFSQKAIVGLPSRQTPCMNTQLTHIVLNPSWTVPQSIFFKDKYHKIIEDPHYLSKNRYIVMDRNGEMVDPQTVSWEHLSGAYFPYRIRQLPGVRNALGSIKFQLDNKEAIYMHGSSNPKLFETTPRSFSSGCVRIQNPLELATWILSHNQNYQQLNLPNLLKTGKTKTISLKEVEAIPVFLVYITTWWDGQHVVWADDDPYQMDKKIFKKTLF